MWAILKTRNRLIVSDFAAFLRGFGLSVLATLRRKRFLRTLLSPCVPFCVFWLVRRTAFLLL